MQSIEGENVWSCDHPEHVNCLSRGSFKCRNKDTGQTFTIETPEDLEAALDALRPTRPDISDVTRCIWMRVCIVPLLDAFTMEAWRLHVAIERGRPWPWSGGFYGQPARFARATEIIDSEQNAIRQEKKADGGN